MTSPFLHVLREPQEMLSRLEVVIALLEKTLIVGGFSLRSLQGLCVITCQAQPRLCMAFGINHSNF